MTIQEAARLALVVDSAVNLSGVVRSFNEVVSALWDEAHRTGQGTAWVNSHCIATLFLHKLTSLNGSECFCSSAISNYTKALRQVEELATEKVTP